MTEPDSGLARIKKRFSPPGVPVDDRGRARMVLDTLVLHLHPARVPHKTLRWTYTWGLGGLALTGKGSWLQMLGFGGPVTNPGVYEDTAADSATAEVSDWRGAILVGGVLIVALALIGGGFAAFQKHSRPPD